MSASPMESAETPDQSKWLRLGLAATFLLAAGLLLFRLSGFGIWDPWELGAAEAARKSMDGSDALPSPPLASWLIAKAFGALAVREWAGRLPVALSGFFSVGLLWLWVRDKAGTRTATYAALVGSTSLGLILNSRQMLGDAPDLLASVLVAAGAMHLFFADDAEPIRSRAPWALAVGVGSVLGILSGGAMLTLVPPLLAVVASAALLGKLEPAKRAMRDPFALATLAWTVGVTAMVALDIWRDTADYSPFVGGAPLGDAPPTYDRSLEVVFHGFAPWSALLPVAIGGSLRLSGEGGELREDAPLRLSALLWAAFALAAHSLFQSRFGASSYPGILALAALVALWLRDLETGRQGFWAAALVTAFFGALIIRDFALYPSSPMDALAVRDAELPEAFNPKGPWALTLGAFTLSAFIATVASPGDGPLRLKAPYAWVVEQWKRGNGGLRAWFVVAALILLGCLVFGLVAVTAGRSLHMSSLSVRIGLGCLVVPFAVPAVMTGVQLGAFAIARLERVRLWPLWATGTLVAAYAAYGFIPAVSDQLSPREIFRAYNEHASEGEPLAEYEVGSGAAAYYATSDVQQLQNRAELLTYLQGEGRRWATFPSQQFADIDRSFRAKAGKHLSVASDPNARVLLVSNEPVTGLDDQNPLAKFVRTERPKVDVPLHIDFEGKIALVGYNLELPNDGYVGPGQSFTVEWVFEALSGNIGNYKVFVHIDGAGNRIHGDHDPVSDKYPVRLWNKGDIVVDRQTLAVPASYRPSPYEIMIGFYRGDNRLKVTEGPSDGRDRAKLGTLTVR